MPRTLAEIAADRAVLNANSQALDAEEAAAVEPLLQEAAGILAAPAFVDGVARLAEIRDLLPGGMAKEQVNNVVIVRVGVASALQRELDRIAAIIALAQTPPPEAPGEGGQ